MGALCQCAPATVLAQALEPPTLTSATVDGLQVMLQWTAVAQWPAEYRIEAGSAPGQSDVAVIDTRSLFNVYSASPVPVGTYYVRVRTVLGTAISNPSNELMITVQGCPPMPLAPTLEGYLGGQSVALRWGDGVPTACEPDFALVEAGLSPGASDIGTFRIAGFSHASFQNVPFGTYYVRVRLVRNGVPGPASNEVRLSIACTLPPALFNPRAEVVGNAARFTWQYDSNPASDFTVFIEAGSSPGLADLASISVPMDANTGFNAAGVAGTYYTRLRAVSACGSTVSREVPVTLTSECPLPGPIPFVNATLSLGNPLQVNWSPSDGGGLPMSYRIEVGSEPGRSDLASRIVDGRWHSTTRPGYEFSELWDGIGASKVHLRVTPLNTCGAGMPSVEVFANSACQAPSPPNPVEVLVQGRWARIGWGFPSEYDPFQDGIVEIGSGIYGKDVLTSPLISAVYPSTPSFSVELPPGRYYARVRSKPNSCGETSNPSREISFVIQP